MEQYLYLAWIGLSLMWMCLYLQLKSRYQRLDLMFRSRLIELARLRFEYLELQHSKFQSDLEKVETVPQLEELLKETEKARLRVSELEMALDLAHSKAMAKE